MTLPDRRRLLGWAAAAWFAPAGATLLAAAGTARAAAPGAFDLVQLMQLLATVKSGQASFVEKRRVETLDRTLMSTGTLSFEAPDSFVRETLRPSRERIAVVGDVVTMNRGGHSRTVALDSVPEAAVIVEAIRGTLTGNREAIERHFTATVSGEPAHWQLELVPLMPSLHEVVVSVRVGGVQALVREVTVSMADGDRSVMTITPITSAPAASAPR